MKIQVLKNETYQSTDNLPKKGTDRATGFDVIVTSVPEIVGNGLTVMIADPVLSPATAVQFASVKDVTE